jgi:hypothetical protein
VDCRQHSGANTLISADLNVISFNRITPDSPRRTCCTYMQRPRSPAELQKDMPDGVNPTVPETEPQNQAAQHELISRD